MPFLNKLTLKIHCWGGLGSQLLALNYYLRVQELYPRKRINLVLHTGGITARNSEIDFLSNKINLLKVDDYRAGSNDKQSHTTDSNSVFNFVKAIIKPLANNFRFVITDDIKVLKVVSICLRLALVFKLCCRLDILSLSIFLLTSGCKSS